MVLGSLICDNAICFQAIEIITPGLTSTFFEFAGWKSISIQRISLAECNILVAYRSDICNSNTYLEPVRC